jgi:hypothetical protein
MIDDLRWRSGHGIMTGVRLIKPEAVPHCGSCLRPELLWQHEALEAAKGSPEPNRTG